MKVGFIGAGTTGTAIATHLCLKGYSVVAVYSRTESSSKRFITAVPDCIIKKSGQGVVDGSDLIFITTPDDVIATVVNQLSWKPLKGVLHCSGAASVDLLETARQQGARVGTFHPLQTFAGYEQAVENMPGSTFALEAEEPLLTILKELVTSLNGYWVLLKPEDKVLYHAAAVITSNYLVTLIKMATDLWQTFGMSTDFATRSLLPLLNGTVRNITNIGLPNCLTGPVARGDMGTVSNHITAIKEKTPQILEAYLELGLNTVPIALAKGKIDENKARELVDLLNKHKGALK